MAAQPQSARRIAIGAALAAVLSTVLVGVGFGVGTAEEGPVAVPVSQAAPRAMATGKVVASIANGTRVDALGWDPDKKLMYIPNGAEGNVTVVHQDSADKYTVVATVPTFAGAKTICVDTTTHNVYFASPSMRVTFIVGSYAHHGGWGYL